jgi:hypothetical protein
MDSTDENLDEPIHLVTFFYVGPSNSYGRRLPGGDGIGPATLGGASRARFEYRVGISSSLASSTCACSNRKGSTSNFSSFRMSCYNSMEEPVL